MSPGDNVLIESPTYSGTLAIVSRILFFFLGGRFGNYEKGVMTKI